MGTETKRRESKIRDSDGRHIHVAMGTHHRNGDDILATRYRQ